MSKKYATQYDKMTKMPVEKLVLQLGLPTTISMLVTTIYSMADTFFVGKLGTSATGSIGILFPLMGVIQAIGFMFGHGCGSHISRLLGAKDKEKAGEFASVSFFSCLLIATVMMIVGLFLIDPLMIALGSTETILPYAHEYGMFILMAIPAMMGSFVLNNILRYEGLAMLAMVGLVTGGVLNIFGDWLTISVLGMGVEGAGIATMLSNYLSMVLLLLNFLFKKTTSRLSIRHLFKSSMDKDLPFVKRSRLISIITTGLPSLARQGMSSIATMSMNWMAGPYGDAAIAAMSIVMRITFILYAIGLGIGQGFQPVCGFNYGAGLYQRVRRSALFTWLFSTVLLTVVSVVIWFISEDLIRLFRDDPDVIAVGTPALHYQMLSMPFIPISFIGNMLFQSIGKNGRALFLSCLRNGLCYIPVLFSVVALWGLLGIEIAQPIADVLSGFITLPFFMSFLNSLKKDRPDH